MNTFLLILEVVAVLIFLIMFLRGSRLVWGIGLVTVTSAVLLDTILGTFGRAEMIDQLGFFFFVIAGALFAGAAVWLWSLLRPLVSAQEPSASPPAPPPAWADEEQSEWAPAVEQEKAIAYDRRMLYEQIRQRFGPDDVRDLIFDLGLNEHDLLSWQQTSAQLILRVMDAAEARDQTGSLALAVERIVTPLPASHLPRPEKLTADSPPTVLRHYLLAHFNEAQVAKLAAELDVEWDNMPGTSKKSKVRSFLLYLYRRERIGELVNLLKDET